MRVILCLSCLLMLASPLLGEDQLRDASTAEMIKEAIPALTYAYGDKSWNGGYSTNASAANTRVDANTAFAVFRAQDSSLSASDIAKQVRAFLIKRFDYPTTEPSSAWEKKCPEGMQSTDFGEAILAAFPPDNVREDQALYLSVQVVRRTTTDFGITISYSTLSKP